MISSTFKLKFEYDLMKLKRKIVLKEFKNKSSL